ncbi:GNAT family N-acetyltransferase [Microbacterium sp. Marseille-Q6965]|uniref:GNAT family N-acetyltransferase n=1 Tax=Microbacterium sp. Marseille-Q6965 TaxID=2965072 RepID=UPI0021B77951|nr:N-acetyltransferase [Microbacterium sp. Marseille-Q6965]
MSAPLSFRTAGPADVPAVVSLVESAYRGESSRAGWTTEADLLDGQRTDAAQVEALLNVAGSVVLLVERGGRLAACCHLEHRDDYAYFGMFAVAPRAQGDGIGRALLCEAERVASEEWGLAELRMTVITARDDLIAWYERRGYRRTGERTPFPYGDERFGLPRRDDLEFETLIKPLLLTPEQGRASARS